MSTTNEETLKIIIQEVHSRRKYKPFGENTIVEPKPHGPTMANSSRVNFTEAEKARIQIDAIKAVRLGL